jgi:hypothetical protein
MPAYNVHRITVALALTGMLLGLAGCAPELATPDGHPARYVLPENDNVLVFAEPGPDFSPYRRVMLEPTEVHLPNAEGIDIEAVQRELAKFVDIKLNEHLSKSFEIVGKPGPDFLRIRFRIVGAEATSKAQLVMMVPPFSMVNMVSPRGAFTGSVTLAGEFFEGESKEASAAFVAYGSRPGIDATVAFRRWDAAKKVIDKMAEFLAQDFEALRSAG